MGLQLKYYFTSTPNPIRCSGEGVNPSIMGLEVMILNHGEDHVLLEAIIITIPSGQEGEHTLSNDPDLPDPEYDVNSGWSVARNGDTFALTPPSAGIVHDFRFTLSKIQVNETPGDVPITISELAPPAPKVTDKTTLTKKSFDCPVTDFRASDTVLYDHDQKVTLFWYCSAQGKGEGYSYSVHSDTWPGKNCLNAGDCYSCQEGQDGVPTPALQKTTVFSLDVIKTDSDGRSIVETLYTTVHVIVPRVSQNSSLSVYLGGRLVVLRWLAFNAVRCAVQLDDTVIDPNALTDTYRQGYVLSPSAQSGFHRLYLIAYGRLGVTATWAFLEFEMNDMGRYVHISLPRVSKPMNLAVTPDSSLALVTDNVRPDVHVINMSTFELEPNPIQVNGPTFSIAITPDGALALATQWYTNGVTVIDIAQRKIETPSIGTGQHPRGIAITPDGTRALVANYKDHNVAVIDIASRKPIALIPIGNPFGPSPNVLASIAITPDGKLAIVGYHLVLAVAVIDLTNLQAKPQTIPLSASPNGIAITPDGELALVLTENFVAVIDIASRQVEPKTIPCNQHSYGIAITPDGAAAFVTNSIEDIGQSLLKIIDIAGRRALPQDITIFAGDAMFMAISSDKNHDWNLTLVATYESVTVL